MKLMVDENIRKLRKALSLTQEQLAEAVGVTVGAVSKWESGLSTPDIGMLLALADFFEISVDVLLGYQLHRRTAELTAAELRELRYAKEYDEGSTEAEKALQRFPNSFDVVFQSAALFRMKGLERGDRAALRRALALYERACGLIAQNTDESVSELSIRISIGEVYISLESDELALAQLKKYNACGVNNATIGFLLARARSYDEALPYLSESLLDSVLNLFRATLGLADCHTNTGNDQTAIGVLLWMSGILDGLKRPGETSYLDKAGALLFCVCAHIMAGMKQTDRAENYLRRAVEAAKAFDAAPSFDVSGIKFYQGKVQSIGDDFGETAMRGIEKMLSDNAPENACLLKLWEELKHTGV